MSLWSKIGVQLGVRPGASVLKPAMHIFTANAQTSRLSVRRMATHRDMGSAWRGNGSSGNNYSKWQRYYNQWKVPVAFTGAVLAFDYFVLPRIFDLPFMAPVRRNPETVVYGLIALNAIGFLAWKGRGTMPTMYRFGLLQKDPRTFRVWSMLGSAFSHQEWWHIGINMFVLYQFGIPVARWMGASSFLESYIDSAVVASLGSMLLPIVFRRYANIPSLGASGAVFSIFGSFCYLAPNARLAFWFIPLPFGAWWVFVGSAAWNVYAFFRRTGGGMDYAGHIAGSIMGVIYGYIMEQRIRRARQRAAQRARSYGGWR